MASKTIHICDRCKSYIEKDTEVIPLAIGMSYSSGSTGVQRAEWGKKIRFGSRNRSVCLACAEEITEEYMMMIGESEMQETLFKGFEPKTESPETLAARIQDYNLD